MISKIEAVTILELLKCHGQIREVNADNIIALIEAQQQEIDRLRTRLISKEPCYTCEISVKADEQIQQLQAKADNQFKRIGILVKVETAMHEIKLENKRLQAKLEKAKEEFTQIQCDLDNADCRGDLNVIKACIDEAIAELEGE